MTFVAAFLLLGCPVVTESDLDAIRDVDGDGEPGLSFGGRDCNDNDPTVGTFAEEVWYDGVDQDCDGADDFDQDGDGFALGSEADSDCDDTNAQEGLASVQLYRDGDGDGFGAGEALLLCRGDEAPGEFVIDGTDCNDANGSIFPGADEVWYDAIDGDCDGGDDFDQDGDGVPWVDGESGDCDDERVTVGVAEELLYRDFDADGFGDPNDSMLRCDVSMGWVEDSTDCGPFDESVYPGAADTWYDGVDSNCDGADDYDQDGDTVVRDHDCDDEDATEGAPTEWYEDSDSDGFGLQDSAAVHKCVDDAAGYSQTDDDCDDTTPEVSPAQSEVCDAEDKDEDCDGDIDDEDSSVVMDTYSLFWPDNDEDGFGSDSLPSMLSCDPAIGYVDNDLDCLDNPLDPLAADANPDAVWYPDRDGDGYGDEDGRGFEGCFPPPGRVANADDCDDSDPLINPEADDAHYTLVDENCDGGTEFDFNEDGVPGPLAKLAAEYGTVLSSCNGTTLHVVRPAPFGGEYSSIQDAIDEAEPCDSVVVWGGEYGDFVLDKPLTIYARLGDSPVVRAGLADDVGIVITADLSLISGLELVGYPVGIRTRGVTVLEHMTITDSVVGVITDHGATVLYGSDLVGGVVAVDQHGGRLDVAESSFTDVHGIAGVISSAEDDDDLPWLSISRSEFRNSSGNELNAMIYMPDGADLEIKKTIFIDNSGPVLVAKVVNATISDVVIRDSVVVGDAAFKLTAAATPGSEDSVATIERVQLTNNAWFPFTIFNGFVQVDDFDVTTVRHVVIRGNEGVGSSTPPVWFTSLGPKHRTIDNIEVSSISGTGMALGSSTLKQATLVGLDLAVQAFADVAVSESILWEVEDALFEVLGASEIRDSVVFAGALSPGDCSGNCVSNDPGFLRYHPLLVGELWDLRMRPDAAFDVASVWPCSEPGFPDTSAVIGQWGAYGNAAGLPNGPDETIYNDCDADNIYDSWQTQFLAFSVLGDLDQDGLSNIAEFEGGTVPTEPDSDGDDVNDGPDLCPLDPTDGCL